MDRRFRDRPEAGRVLAGRLARYAGRDDVIVLALPRGGVPVAYEVARALNAPLDVFLVRKLGVPGHEELAMGAIASGGVRALYEPVVRGLGIPDQVIDEVADAEQAELDRRAREYRDDRPEPELKGKVAILVDDGLATGASMRAAVEALRKAGPRRIVVAVPVASSSTCEEFQEIVDEVVCASTPEPFRAVGIWYDDFSQTTDAEVRDLLERASARREAGATERSVRLAATGVVLEGDLDVPDRATGVVLFAHGSGSSRHSPRNRRVAAALREGGLGTLLIDLLTPDEEAVDALTGHLRFDIGLLARRLVVAIDWLGSRPETRGLEVGLFGASTGGGAALVAAAERPRAVAAVVSRGGRPDLAGDALPRVKAPTLLIVGGLDRPVIALNRQAVARMGTEVEVAIIPGASHLFEEPGRSTGSLHWRGSGSSRVSPAADVCRMARERPLIRTQWTRSPSRLPADS